MLPTPPQPALAPWAQTWRFFRDPFGLIRSAREQCGDLFAIRVYGFGHGVVICSPRILADLYRRPLDEVVAGKIRGPMVGFLVGDRVSLAQDGEPHQRRRRATTPLLGAHKLRMHEVKVLELVHRTLDRCPRGQGFEVQDPFDDFTLRTMLYLLFRHSSGEVLEDFVTRAEAFLRAMRSPLVLSGKLRWNLGPWSPWGHFVRVRRRLYGAVRSELARRESAEALTTLDPSERDLFEALRLAHLEDDPEAQREALEQEVAAFCIGGSETTSRTLAWTLLGLLESPAYLDRLRHEVDTVLADRPFTLTDLDRMPYLAATIQEGLRIQPLTPLVGQRLAVRDLDLGGYHIAAGTVLFQAHAETGRNGRFPRPDDFDPENFLDRDVSMADHLPFGGGSRMCTGMALVNLEIGAFLATLLQRFDVVKTAGNATPRPSGIAFQPTDFAIRLDPRC